MSAASWTLSMKTTHLCRSSEAGGTPADTGGTRRPPDRHDDQSDGQDGAQEHEEHCHGQPRPGEPGLVAKLPFQGGGDGERVKLAVATAVVVVGRRGRLLNVGRRGRRRHPVVLLGRFLQARLAFLVGGRQAPAVRFVLHLHALVLRHPGPVAVIHLEQYLGLATHKHGRTSATRRLGGYGTRVTVDRERTVKRSERERNNDKR